jgi:Recombination enhancement, RecA-dependent nuclease
VTKAEKAHLNRVAELGCCVCRRIGYGPTPAEIHHPRRGTGMGQRASNMDALPMCPEHHRGNTGLHGLGTKGFARHYGFDEADLLADVRRLIDSQT